MHGREAETPRGLARGAITAGRLVSLLLAWTASACGQAGPEARPNVLLICVDALRADHLGFMGYRRPTSPTLDELAARGARFRRCFSTYPQTAASVASIFTSLYPSAHRKTNDVETTLTSSVPLLAQTFLAAGYRTGAVTTNPHLSPGIGYEQGFENYCYVTGASVASRFEGARQYEDSEVEVRTSRASYYGRGDAANQATLDWLDAPDDERPFFLYVHYMDVHSPYVSPSPFHGLFVEKPGQDRYCNGLPSQPVRPADLRYMRALYDGEIRYLDATLSRLVGELEALGRLENTYIAFVSDHGDEFLEHGGLGHGGTLFSELLRVPLVLVGPGIAAGDHDRLASTIDLYPTLCELAGLEIPDHVQGRSLVPLLLGDDAAEAPREVLAECTGARTRTGPAERREEPALSIVDDEWQLIHWPETGDSELYRYATDPLEIDDLSAAYPEEVERLTARAVEAWEASLTIGDEVETEEVRIDAETHRQLEALGYGGEDDGE